MSTYSLTKPLFFTLHFALALEIFFARNGLTDQELVFCYQTIGASFLGFVYMLTKETPQHSEAVDYYIAVLLCWFFGLSLILFMKAESQDSYFFNNDNQMFLYFFGGGGAVFVAVSSVLVPSMLPRCSEN